jgi:hypothetical protein
LSKEFARSIMSASAKHPFRTAGGARWRMRLLQCFAQF